LHRRNLLVIIELPPRRGLLHQRKAINGKITKPGPIRQTQENTLNQVIIGWGVSLLLFIAGVGIPSGKAYAPEFIETQNQEEVIKVNPVMSKSVDRLPEPKPPKPQIAFKWGDISWLPLLAAEAGWPEETWPKLGQIILRESGGCPNRRGGDAVDENCNITHVTEWNHRSDTGLLQINGVNYNTSRNKWARVCLDMGVCEQEPLLDAVTNLKAGYVLYTYSGWDPWDPCAWGDKWAHKCKRSKKA